MYVAYKLVLERLVDEYIEFTYVRMSNLIIISSTSIDKSQEAIK